MVLPIPPSPAPSCAGLGARQARLRGSCRSRDSRVSQAAPGAAVVWQCRHRSRVRGCDRQPRAARGLRWSWDLLGIPQQVGVFWEVRWVLCKPLPCPSLPLSLREHRR